MENILSAEKPEAQIDAYDFAAHSTQWLTENNTVFILNDLNSSDCYDFIYCIQLCYALNDLEVFELAKDIRKKLKKNGLFLTVDSSLNPKENGKAIISENFLKYYLRLLYRMIFQSKQYQFWGWMRDNSHLDKILSESRLDQNTRV